MSQIVTCPQCGKKLRVAEGTSARRLRCPHCRTAFATPAEQVSSPAEQAVPATQRSSSSLPWILAWVCSGVGAALLLAVLGAWLLSSPRPVPEPETPVANVPPPEPPAAKPTVALPVTPVEKPPAPPPEKPAPPVVVELPEPLRGLWKEINVPPVQIGRDPPPPFKTPAIERHNKVVRDRYTISYLDTPLRDRVHQARVVLWALTPVEAPIDLRPEVKKLKAELQIPADRPLFVRQLRAPSDAGEEKKTKQLILTREKSIARILGQLSEVEAALEKAGGERSAEPKRWQANFDYVRARVQAQLAYVYEYQSLMGQVRRDFPPRDAKTQNGWRLIASEQLRGDSTGKKLGASSHKLLEKIVQELPESPWAELAKQDLTVPLGLDWQAARLK